MKFIYTLIAIFFLGIPVIIQDARSSQISDQQICIADIQVVFKQSDAEKDAMLELQSKQQEMTAKLDNLGKDIEELSESLQRESMVMNEKTKGEKERNIRIKINDLQSMKVKFQEELDAMQQELVSAIEKEIMDVLPKVARSKGFSLVLNNATVLFSENISDVTNAIIEEYNKEYAKKKKRK